MLVNGLCNSIAALGDALGAVQPAHINPEGIAAMKQVTKYEADDGSLFDSSEECEEHEERTAIIDRIYNELRNADYVEIYNWIIANTKGFK